VAQWRPIYPASELNALAATSMVDFHQRLSKKTYNDKQKVRVSKVLTIGWVLIAITIALSASLFDNLIQLVNYLGSLFYGTILGIFVVGLFIKKIKGNQVFWSALIAEVIVLLTFGGNVLVIWDIGYLWFNVIGCFSVVLLSLIFHQIFHKKQPL
tara:strand:+ start:680 stop:1144 length:465 start_codon:yes stop_codon:yes gene_type:complete